MNRSGFAIFAILLAACGHYSPLDSHYNRGVEFYDQGRSADAAEEYRLAVEDNPANYRARFNLGVCYHDLGQLDAARKEYEEALLLSPGSARILVNLAALAFEQKRDAEGLEFLARAAKAEPQSPIPPSSRGAYHERKGDADAALADYRAAVALDPHHAAGHCGIARLLAIRGDREGAINAYDTALAADPDDVSALVASSELVDPKGAALRLERALVHDSDRADLWMRLSGYYEADDRLEDAVAALWEARAISPGLEGVEPRLRALYEKLARRG